MTDEKQQPHLVLICGPNGAGKSTFTNDVAIANDYPVVDADKIAKDRGLGPMDAGKEASRMIKSYLDDKRSFVRESTLTANYDFKLMEETKQKGYKVSMVYIGLNSKEMSQQRVNRRFALGGHNVPKEDIARRYDKSIANLFKAVKIADEVKVYDNSQKTRQQVATFEKGQLVKQFSTPQWFQKGYDKSLELEKNFDLKQPDLQVKYEGYIVEINDKHIIQAVKEDGQTVHYAHNRNAVSGKIQVGDNVKISHMTKNMGTAVQIEKNNMPSPASGMGGLRK